MIDRLFTLTLTFTLLVGGTLAIGGEFFPSRTEPSQPVAQLPRVVVTGSVERKQTDVARVEESATESRNGQRTQ
ncbi:hypothetical protein [Piscinibacter sakaiensis]|uniref:hypothetical protein n=1 Tax=Piscinibacter sakaiensis TaxID=1547922 RepID=UPI003AADE161